MISHPEDNTEAQTPIRLGEIEQTCSAYESESAKLETLINSLEAELDSIKNRHMRGIKNQAAKVAGLEAMLFGMIEGSPQVFKSPRTLILHGIKVGFSKSKGSIAFDDEESVLKLIRRLRKDDAETFIRTTFEVNKDALRMLTTEELAKLGCRIEGDGDQVVLSRTAGEVEKLIKKLLSKLVEAMAQPNKAE